METSNDMYKNLKNIQQPTQAKDKKHKRPRGKSLLRDPWKSL